MNYSSLLYICLGSFLISFSAYSMEETAQATCISSMAKKIDLENEKWSAIYCFQEFPLNVKLIILSFLSEFSFNYDFKQPAERIPQHLIVEALAPSSDGKTMLMGCQDHNAYLWDSAENRIVQELKGHKGPVFAVAFSCCEKYAFTGSSDGTACFWDLSNGASLKLFKGHAGKVSCVAVSPHGDVALTGLCNDSTVFLWDLSTGKKISMIKGQILNGITDVAFSKCGQKALITVSKNKGLVWEDLNTVRTLVWDLNTVRTKELSVLDGEEITIPSGTSDWKGISIRKGVFNYTDKMIAFSSCAGKVSLCDDKEELLATFDDGGYKAITRFIKFSPCGTILFALLQPGTVCFWDIEKKKLLNSICAGRYFASAAYSFDSKVLVVSAVDKNATPEKVCLSWGLLKPYHKNLVENKLLLHHLFVKSKNIIPCFDDVFKESVKGDDSMKEILAVDSAVVSNEANLSLSKNIVVPTAFIENNDENVIKTPRAEEAIVRVDATQSTTNSPANLSTIPNATRALLTEEGGETAMQSTVQLHQDQNGFSSSDITTLKEENSAKNGPHARSYKIVKKEFPCNGAAAQVPNSTEKEVSKNFKGEVNLDDTVEPKGECSVQ